MKVTKGRVQKPIAMLLYGVHGVGKSTFATEAENPIFIGSEENDEIEASRLPKIKDWSDLAAQFKWVASSDHKTVVIDTMDELERIAQKEILKKEPGKTMATACGGFGKANEVMEQMFLVVRDSLAYLRDEKGMNIIILCHHEKNKHEDPISLTSYDTYSTALHKRIKPIFEDWVSIIAFANDKLLKAENSKGEDTVISDGDKVMYFQSRTSHTAKNRFNLPEEIEFNRTGTWKFIKDSVDDFFKQEKAKANETKKDEPKKEDLDHDLVKQIEETISKIKTAGIGDKIKVSLARATDNKELKRILEKAKTLV